MKHDIIRKGEIEQTISIVKERNRLHKGLVEIRHIANDALNDGNASKSSSILKEIVDICELSLKKKRYKNFFQKMWKMREVLEMLEGKK